MATKVRASQPAPSLAGRAVLALALTVGFYVFALAIAAALIFVVYLQVYVLNYASLLFVIVPLIGALAILAAIFPRFDSFAPPGPRLLRKDQEKLFALVQEVARATRQRTPGEVYLTMDVNAGVTQRGGFLGIFSRRVMILGLPLVQVLSRSELRAVLAHEFGHFSGGDTAFGSWIYQTRLTIGRTIGAAGGNVPFLDLPFDLYGELFLRVTQSIARQQEWVADQLAAEVASGDALANALWKMTAASLVFEEYFSSQVVPVLEGGFCPPIAEGFGRYLTAALQDPKFIERVNVGIARESAEDYDSHPLTRDRIDALRHNPTNDLDGEDGAIALIENLSQLEIRLFGSGKIAVSLEPISWDEVGSRVYLPRWRKQIEKHVPVLKGVTVESLPSLARRLYPTAEKLGLPLSHPERARRQAAEVLSIALTTGLIRQGWTPEAVPGRPVVCRRQQMALEPLTIIQALADGNLSGESWRQLCQQLGLSGLQLIGD